MAVRLINGAEFIHIPKTGGSWVEQALRQCGLVDSRQGHKHADFDRVQNHNRLGSLRELRRTMISTLKIKNWTTSRQRGFRFCFVRHPLKWLESHWKYKQGRNWSPDGEENSKSNWHPNSALNGLGSSDFNQFVRNVIRKRPGYVSEFFFSYTKPGISFIGKTESLVDDLIEVLKLQGLKFDEAKIRGVERVNVSKTNPAEIQWDPQLKTTVTRLELPALIHFDYLTPAELAALALK